MPLSCLGLLLHGINSWDSQEGILFRKALWNVNIEQSWELIHALESLDLLLVRGIVQAQRRLIPETQDLHQKILSLLKMWNGNKSVEL